MTKIEIEVLKIVYNDGTKDEIELQVREYNLEFEEYCLIANCVIHKNKRILRFPVFGIRKYWIETKKVEQDNIYFEE